MSRLALLLPNLGGGGAERVQLELARAFLAAGHDVELLVTQAEGELLAEAEALCSVTDMRCNRARELLSKLTAYLRSNNPDGLVAAMWPLTAIAPFARLLSRSSTRVVVAEHNMLSRQYADWGALHRLLLRFSTALGYRLADRAVGVSSGVVADMASLSWSSASAIELIYNPLQAAGTDSSAAAVGALPQGCWSEHVGPKLLSVGSLTAQKNHALLVRALAALPDSTAELVIAGEGPLRPQLLALAQELGVAGRVHLPGFVSDPGALYRTADLFVLSSDYEGFGLVIVEALAYALPVIATDCPSGPAEILDDGRYGTLVPVGDVQALTAAIEAATEVATEADLSAPASQRCSPAELTGRAASFAPATVAQRYLRCLAMRGASCD